jgi:hypothetical protein
MTESSRFDEAFMTAGRRGVAVTLGEMGAESDRRAGEYRAPRIAGFKLLRRQWGGPVSERSVLGAAPTGQVSGP